MVFRALRERIHLSPTTVIATLALVFAMTGGAYAAKKYLITSTKQISPKGDMLKALQGKAGPAGANGPAGPVGPQGPAGGPGGKGENGKEGAAGKNGENGKPGENGKAGANGKSVTVNEIQAGGSGCSGEGGVSVEAEGSGKPHEVCNGAEGKEGSFKGAIASKTLLKGTWSVLYNAAAHGEDLPVAISMGVPIKAIPATSAFFVWSSAALGGENPVVWELVKEWCPGTPEAPLPPTAAGVAEGGIGCLYIGGHANLETGGESAPEFKGSGGGAVLGSGIESIAAGRVYAAGTWAMEAP